MSRSYFLLALVAAGTAAAQSPSFSANKTAASVASAAVTRRYGTAVKLGDGSARSYVLFDEHGAPREIGVALSERALEGLPTAGSGHHGSSMMTHEFIISLPEDNKTPFRFLELNWN